MPGKGHYKIFVYERSVWHSYRPGKYVIYDLDRHTDWWDGMRWSYRRTIDVGTDAHGEPYVPPNWLTRAYAYTEWEWETKAPNGTDLWASQDGKKWESWYTPKLIYGWHLTHPYKGWTLLGEGLDTYWAGRSKL